MKYILLSVTFIFIAALANAQVATSYKFTGEQAVFTENQGQVVDMDGKPVPDVLAKASVPGLDMYLTKTGVTYVMLQYTEDLTAKPHPVFINDKKLLVTFSRVDVALTGATLGKTQMLLTNAAEWQSNYYRSADGKGQLAVQHFKNMTVQNVYPGIDWVWKFNTKGNLEYEFVVHPGADPSVIKMQYSYADLKAAKNSLVISTRKASITEGPLQASSGNGKVAISYNLNAANKEISFAATGYDKTQDLVIDPPLALNWSAEFGGSFTNGLRGVTTDTSGYVYLCGYTTSNDFPVYHYYGGYIDSTLQGQTDAILIKLDSLQHLKWATYFGGPGNDFANSVTFSQNPLGGYHFLYVTGGAETGFPVLNGTANHGGQDAFVAAFNTYLQLQISSFYGGTGADEGLKIHFDPVNNVSYVVGYTNSTGNSFSTNNYNNLGYLQSTVTGQEAFIMQLTYEFYQDDFHSFWTTMFGGSGDDYATGVTTDSIGDVAVTGYTSSTNMPVLHGSNAYYQAANAGGNDGFIAKFNQVAVLQNSTYYGGSGDDYFTDVTTGLRGAFEFTGRTNSTNFPIDSIYGFSYNQDHRVDAAGDAFVVKLQNNMVPQWATYYGGNALDAGTGIATDKAGNIFVSGFTFSTNFPLDSFPGSFFQSTNHGNSDGFVAMFTDLGIQKWSTYKGDSCYQYPYDIAYDINHQKFYIAGQGMLACTGDTAGQSLPDTGQITGGVSSVGFCWGFKGPVAPPCGALKMDVSYPQQPCPGQCNGIVQIAVQDTVSYNIIWSTGATTALDSNLCLNSWVEVKDTLGCTLEQDMGFSPLTVTMTGQGITCLPGNSLVNGYARNGNSQLEYNWSTGGGYSFTSYIFVTDTGLYTVTAEDGIGCTASASFDVGFYTVPEQDSIVLINYPSCGNSDGVVTLTGRGTDEFFPNGSTIVWKNGNQVLGTGDTLYNVTTGITYSVIDSAYCFRGQTSPMYFYFTIDPLTSLAMLQATGPTTCTSNDGQGIVTFMYQNVGQQGNNYNYNGIGQTIVVDTMPSVSYLWSNGETTATVTDLGNAYYSVTVSDANCLTVLYDTIPVLPAPVSVPVVDSAYCLGSQSGGIDLSNVSGGAGGPYTYLWTNGDTGPVETGLFPGTYTATITDAGGCGTIDTIYVPQGTFVEINLTVSPPLCNGQQGSITVTGGAGVPPYSGTGTYNYSAGTYSFTIFDSQGCQASSNATVTQPTQLTETIVEVAPAGCGSSTETISVSASGGTPPYIQGTGINYVDVGTDIVSVTDANGCIVSDTITVTATNQSNIALSSSATRILCYGDTSTVTITATGGHGHLTGTGIFKRTAGTYYFTVTDSVGCSAADTVVINQPTQLTVNPTSVGITCTPGSITANASGGSPLYLYQWSDAPGSFSDSSIIPVSVTGTYSVTVQDENLCTATASTGVNYINLQPPYFNFGIQLYPSCGQNNGIIYFTDPNPANVTWIWNSGNNVTYGDTIYNAITDVNYYEVIDSSYCVNGVKNAVVYYASVPPAFPADNSISVIQPVGNTSANPTGCNTQDGYLNTAVNNIPSAWTLIDNNTVILPVGIPVNNYSPINYQWSNGVSYTLSENNPYYTAPGIANLDPGTYYLTVTDGTCQTVDTITLTATTPPLTASYNVTNSSCSLSANGNIQFVSFANSIGTNTYAWSNGATTQSVSDLAAGTYIVTITGPNACPVNDTFNISGSISTLQVKDSIIPIACFNGNNATVIVSASGGTSPYTGTGTFIKTPGNYILTVTDATGCSANDSIVVHPSVATSALVPNETAIPVSCHGGNSTVTITATGGIAPYTGTGVSQKPAGNYVVAVTDSLGCSVNDTFTITQPGILYATNVVAPVLCYGGNATINLSCAGGTAPYTGTGTFIRPAGNYVFDITDANGCIATDSVYITQPTLLSVTDTATQLLCYGAAAAISVYATGGTGPYYGTGQIMKAAGNYVLYVSDANGCADSVSVNINQPSPVLIGIQLTDSAHCLDSIKAIVTATGGNGPYTGLGSITYTRNGNYTITVTDVNGCSVDTTMHILLDTCTGISLIDGNFGVTVYPNPASDKFYIKFLTALNVATDVRLYAVDGKLIALKRLGPGTDLCEMDCNNLAAGVYILRTIAAGKEYNFKVVVTR